MIHKEQIPSNISSFIFARGVYSFKYNFIIIQPIGALLKKELK